MNEDIANERIPMSKSMQIDGTSLMGSGVRPAQQARSKATLRALLQAGHELLEEGSLEELTINDVAIRSGTSVGTFYGRFENKEVFFYAIQEKTLSELGAQLDAMFARLKKEKADASQHIESITAFWINIYRNNRGLYRAAFKHSSAAPGAWTPFKRFGYRGSNLIVDVLLPVLVNQKVSCSEMQIRAAMQFVNGLLVNATINDPGPVKLDDQDMQAYVSRFLHTFLGLEPPAGQLNQTWQRLKDRS